MYGLKQAAILAYDQLVKCLAPHGYEPMPFTPSMWRHKTQKTLFCLCVDDFGINFFNQSDKEHLINALQQHYRVTIDHQGTNYCGLNLNWKYHKGYVDVSMPNYIPSL
mmetsp:Transcript_15150/g.21608  ORF Transcript_15150/g.21608 Transcript_15150/m.21608 type:complete len:108 (+) Transcript_15150:254-577(+)